MSNVNKRIELLARRLRLAPILPAEEGVALSAEEAEPARFLPHRPPMLLLDAIEAVDREGGRVRARRRVAPDDPVLSGHFPGVPIYPGVLLIEMMAQTALAALPLARPGGGAQPLARFTRVRDAAFLAPVGPGDQLEIHAEAVDDGLLVTALGQVWRGETLCACAISEALLDE